MKRKFFSKMKIGTTFLCGVFFATMITGTAFAAEPNVKNTSNKNKVTILEEMDNSSNKSTNNNKNVSGVSTSTDKGGTRTQGLPNRTTVANDDDNILYKTENGITYYSTDGGNTWTKTVSPGTAVKKETNSNTGISGKQVTNQSNTRPQGLPDRTTVTDDNDKILYKIENGITYCSTDEGETWTETVSPGTTVKKATDSDTSINGKQVIIKNNTWSQGLPNRTTVTNDNDKILYKIENGITYYSTDEGETWTETVSQGTTVKKTTNSNTSINGKQVTIKNNTWSQGLTGWSAGMKNNSNIRINDKQVTIQNNTWSQGLSSWWTVKNNVVKKNNNSTKIVYYDIVYPNGKGYYNSSTSGSKPSTQETTVMLIYIKDGVYYYSTDQGKTWTEITVSESVGIAENSTFYYTTDGETWTDGLPDGLVVVEDEDGDLYIIEVIALIYIEDGTYYCSIDRGETWTEITASEGVSIYENSNFYYTTDGETWTQGLPDGLTVEEDEYGNIYIAENDS